MNSNRLFSSFLSGYDLKKVSFFSYFPLIEKADYITILPSDHAYYYPLTFNKVTKEIVNGELNFFNKIIFENYASSQILGEDKYQLASNKTNHSDCLIVNLVDNCYGHSFLKLLNLIRIYEQYHDKYDIWVICPKPLAHFIPQDKFYLCMVKLGFEEAIKCTNLSPVVNLICEKYSTSDFVTLDTYASYDCQINVNNFFGFLPSEKKLTKKYITFYYRSDYFRSWAGVKQPKRIINFFKSIKPYFNNCEFLVAGDKDNFKFPDWINDIRTNEFSKDVDLTYNNYFNNSHIVIGIIGSNMLQPSMMCDFTVHLVPEPKVTIVAEELFNHNETAILGWFKNIYLFGNEDLSDMFPEKLAKKIVLLYLTFIAKKFKVVAYSNELFDKQISQKQFYTLEYNFFNYEKATQLKETIGNNALKKNLIKYKFNKIFRLFKK